MSTTTKDNGTPGQPMDAAPSEFDMMQNMMKMMQNGMTISKEAQEKQEKALKAAAEAEALKNYAGKYFLQLPGSRSYILAIRVIEEEGEDPLYHVTLLDSLDVDTDTKPSQVTDVSFTANFHDKARKICVPYLGFAYETRSRSILRVSLNFTSNGNVVGNASGPYEGQVVGSRIC